MTTSDSRIGRGTRSGPSYDDLPEVEGDTGERYAWNVWAPGDELGTINRITPRHVADAATLVRSGEVLSLSLPLNQPAPGLFENREPYTREETRTNLGREDRLTHLDLQFSSQWDGLRHIRHKTAGYYGGRSDAEVDAGALGVEKLARRGLVGRGVLLDLPGHFAATGRGYWPDERIALEPDDVDEILERQGTVLGDGDVLLIHTGWIDWYLALGEPDRRGLLGSVHGGDGGLACPGLIGTPDMARWLWDAGLAAVASDNPTVEALPVRREDGFLHRRVLPLLGMPFGELWSLGELTRRCRDRGVYDFLLSSAPLDIPSGVASPANALAIL